MDKKLITCLKVYSQEPVDNDLFTGVIWSDVEQIKENIWT